MNGITYSIMAINIVIVIIGLVGNSLVITVVKKTRSMRTTTNFLLVNLAVADIFTLLLNPFLHANLWPKSVWSDSLCKFFTGNGFVGLPIMVSLFTLVIIAVERYHALVKPMATGLRLTEENIHYAIVSTWCVATVLNIPILVDYRFDEQEERCKGAWSLDFSTWIAKYITFYCVVAIAVTFIDGFCCFQIFKGLYITNTICSEISVTEEERRSKKKLTKLLILVTAMFYVCHLPFNVFMIVMATKNPSGNFPLTIFNILAGIAFTNSSINPIAYAFQSTNYRSGFKKIFRCQTMNVEENHVVHLRVNQNVRTQPRSQALSSPGPR